MFWAIVLMFVNFGISWFNAWQVGRSWNAAKDAGWGAQLVVWSAGVMSACGFTWVYVFLVTIGLLTTGNINQEQARVVIEIGYLAIIFPVLGSGMVLTIHSWIVAARERTISSFGTAAWNTYAQISNISDAASGLGGVFKHLGSLLKSDSDSDSDSGGGVGVAGLLLGAAIVSISLGAGVLTTVLIARSAASGMANELELMARRRQDFEA